MRKPGLLAAAIILATAVPAVAQDIKLPPVQTYFPGITASGGIDYSSGGYGDPKRTDILVGLTSLGISEDDFQFTASLPYLNITGPAYVVVGPGGLPVLVNPKKGEDSTTRSGWGDLNLSLTYNLPSEDLDDFEVALTARTKVATASDAKGLSTGATDYAFSVDISRPLESARVSWMTPFLTFSYRVPGSPTFYSFRDAPSFSVGTSAQVSSDVIAIVSYDFDGSISSSLADAQQLFSSVSWLVTDRFSLTVYVEKGLSSGAPGQGTGMLLSWKVN